MSKPRNLSFKECMAMMRKHAALTQEEGFHYLLPRAKEHVSELIAEFETESDHGLRCWLMELIGEARSERAFELLCEYAQSSDESLQDWAIRGLDKLGTKPARTFLFQRGLNL